MVIQRSSASLRRNRDCHKVPERGLAGFRPRQSEKRLLGDAEQGAPENGGKRQVILGQKQKAAKRDQVTNRDMLVQKQPVAARDRYAGLLQLAGERIDEGASLSHQNKHVSRIGLSPFPPGRDVTGELRGKPRHRAGCGKPVQRFRPVLGLDKFLTLLRRPDLDMPRLVAPDRLVNGFDALLRQSLVHGGIREDRVDRRQDIGPRTERKCQFKTREVASGLLRLASEKTAHLVKIGRDRALEGVDRLLFVPDREKRAVPGI